MKSYKLCTEHSSTITVSDEELVFPHYFRKVHWARNEILAVSVEGIRKNNVGAIVAFGVLAAGSRKQRTVVSITHNDGTVRRFTVVRAPASEVATAFDVRGYQLIGV